MFIKRLHFTRALASLAILLIGVWVLSGYSGDETDYPGGSPAGYTGSPADGKDCTQCHGGSTATVINWISSTIPSDGYNPGQSYTITVSVSGSGKKGFEVSPQTEAGELLGILTPGSGNELVGNGKYVTQSSGSNSNPAIWSFTWLAPAAGTGNVTFYGAFTVGKLTTKTSTLSVTEAQILGVTASTTNDTLCYGNTTTLLASTVNATGNVAYLWTSEPAGFTSTEQNPSVAPTETTTYTVTANSGGSSASASINVFVDACNGLIDNELASQISINPNPTSGAVTLTLPESSLGWFRVDLFQTDGTKTYSTLAEAGSTHTISRKNLPTGLAIIKISNNHFQATKKLVVR